MIGGSRDRTALVVAAALLLVLAGCGTGPSTGGTASVQSASPTCVSRVTADCSAYTYSSPGRGTVVVTAPKSTGGNNREFFWAPGGPSGPDLTVCARFEDGSGSDQQGVVLRLEHFAGGRVAAVTVTRNVWAGAFDVFNYHVWNTRADPGKPFIQFGSTVIPVLPVAPAVYPLHLCARTLSDRVEFVVWTDGQARPAWGSTTQGGAATIPAAAPSNGQGGWFAGHLRPGTSMTYDDLSVDGTVAAGLP